MSTDLIVSGFDDDNGREIRLDQSAGALGAITRAEIDTAIATARRFPRSLEKFLKESEALVTYSPELAAKCTYALKRWDAKKQKNVSITGPSVRLAEMLAYSWGNVRIVGRIVGQDGQTITAEGTALDLERNVGYCMESRRAIANKDGKTFSGDMIVMTGNACIAIATRNATFKVIPRAFVGLVHAKAQAVARGELATLDDRRNELMNYFGSQGVKDPEMFAALEVAGFHDVNLDHLELMQGFKVAVEEGTATVDDIFRPKLPTSAKGEPKRDGESRSDELARRLEEKAREAAARRPAPADLPTVEKPAAKRAEAKPEPARVPPTVEKPAAARTAPKVEHPDAGLFRDEAALPPWDGPRPRDDEWSNGYEAE